MESSMADEGSVRRGRMAAVLVVLVLGGALAATAVARFGERPPSPLAPPPAPVPGATTVRVEVLNGAGRAGLARQATDQLREVGFDVVFFGNAGRFDHSRSVVLHRAGDPAGARSVAATLGIDSIATELDGRLLLDVTVLLGPEWGADDGGGRLR
jgi:hypothetical protein